MYLSSPFIKLQLRGQKQVTLFAPHNNENLYEAHIPQAMLKYSNRSKKFFRHGLEESTSMVMSPVDLLNPDFEVCWCTYCQTFNIRYTKSWNFDVSRLVLQLSLCSLLKSGVTSEIWGYQNLNHWSLEDPDVILEMQFSILIYWLVSSDLVIMPPDECHGTFLMISQHWFRWWLGANRQCWPSFMSPYGITRPQ